MTSSSSPVIFKDTMHASSITQPCVSPSQVTGCGEPSRTDYSYSSAERVWIQTTSQSSSSPPPRAQPDSRSELTSSPDSRITVQNLDRPPFPSAAISAPIYNNSYQTSSQDVHLFVNQQASYQQSTADRFNVYSTLSDTTTHPPHCHVITSPTARPRTSNQVFSSPQDLAAHYGIPQILPPAPRPTTVRQPQPPIAVTDFDTLRSNYLNMLSQKPTDNTMSVNSTPVSVGTASPADMQAPVMSGDQEAAAMEVAQLLMSSPDFLSSPEFQSFANFDQEHDYMNEFISSPLIRADEYDDDSPFTPQLETPDQGTLEPDMLTSPMVAYPGMSLFGGSSFPAYELPPTALKLDLDKMYTMSPANLSLDSVNPASLYPSPRLPSDGSSFPSPAPPARRKSSATGTRKNITPESLVPLDAPTQPRKYVTPSATSRKEVPAVFAKKRARSQAWPEDEDELAQEEPLPPDATEKEHIEWKRRQNTLAARKSRQRKLRHQQGLEERVRQLEEESKMWKTRAITAQQVLKSHGIPVQEFQD